MLKTPWGCKTLWQWSPSGYFGSIFPYCSHVSNGGRSRSGPLQHKGYLDQATAWGHPPKYRQTSKQLSTYLFSLNTINKMYFWNSKLSQLINNLVTSIYKIRSFSSKSDVLTVVWYHNMWWTRHRLCSIQIMPYYYHMYQSLIIAHPARFLRIRLQ